LAVRVITASISASHHMLRQPEAPAPTAIISSEAKAITGWVVHGRHHHADEGREHHEEHHPRLQQREEVGHVALGDRRGRKDWLWSRVGVQCS
jgi:hypothetical protein